jgi:hypothetical protein
VSAWYIYWRLREDDLVPAMTAALRWQQQLRSRAPMLEAAMWRRTAQDAPPATEPPGMATLMEVYAQVPEDLRAEVEAAAVLKPWLQGQRHIERFEHLSEVPMPTGLNH